MKIEKYKWALWLIAGMWVMWMFPQAAQPFEMVREWMRSDPPARTWHKPTRTYHR